MVALGVSHLLPWAVVWVSPEHPCLQTQTPLSKNLARGGGYWVVLRDAGKAGLQSSSVD